MTFILTALIAFSVPVEMPPPMWFQRLPERPGFVYGAGSGRDPNLAEAEARRQIAIKLISSIRSELKGNHQETQTVWNGDGINRRDLTYTISTNIDTFPAVCVAERGTRGDTHYALAVLDVNAAVEQMQAEFQVISNELKVALNPSRWEQIPLEQKLRFLGQCRQSTDKAKTLVRTLTLLVPYSEHLDQSKLEQVSEEVLKPASDFLEKQSFRRVALRGEKGYLSPSPAYDPLVSALTDMGLVVGREGDLTLIWKEVESKTDVYGISISRFTFTMTLLSPNGDVLHSTMETFPTSNPSEARRTFITRHVALWFGFTPSSATSLERKFQ